MGFHERLKARDHVPDLFAIFEIHAVTFMSEGQATINDNGLAKNIS